MDLPLQLSKKACIAEATQTKAEVLLQHFSFVFVQSFGKALHSWLFLITVFFWPEFSEDCESASNRSYGCKAVAISFNGRSLLAALCI